MMRRRLCAAILVLQAVTVGLTAPVLISVVGVSVAQGLWIGLGLAGACLLVSGLLRYDWAYYLGWLLQFVAIALGVLVTAMFTLGAIFLVLWATAYFMGGNIDRERAAAYAAYEAEHGPLEG